MHLESSGAFHATYLILRVPALSLLLSSCTWGNFIASGSGAGYREDAATYYLPLDILEVTIQATEKTQKRITSLTLGSDGALVPAFDTQVSMDYAVVTLDVKTIADTSNIHYLDIEPSAIFADKLTVSVSSQGLLTAVNSEHQGQGGAVIKSVFALAGNLMPLQRYWSVLGDAPLPNPAVNVFTNNATLNGDCWTDSDLLANHLPNTLETRYGLSRADNSQRLKSQYCNAIDAVDACYATFFDRVSKSAAQPPIAPAPAPVPAPVTTTKDPCQEVAALALTRKQALLDAINVVLNRESIGSNSRQVEWKQFFKTQELPSAEALTMVTTTGPAGTAGTPIFNADLAAADVRERLCGKGGAHQLHCSYEEAIELYVRSGLILTASPMSGPINEGTIPALTESGSATQNLGEKVTTACFKQEKDWGNDGQCLFYRSPSPVELSAWRVDGGDVKNPKKGLLKKITGKVEPIITGQQTHALALHSSIFSKRNVELSFNDRGRLNKVERDYTASASDALGDTNQAVQDFRTQYKSALTDVESILTTQGKIAIIPSNTAVALSNNETTISTNQATISANKLKLLTDELNAFKQQLELQTIKDNQATIIATKVNTLLKELEVAKQVLLDAEVLGIASAVGRANAVETARLSALLDYHDAQLQILQKELALLRAQKDIADFHKPQP